MRIISCEDKPYLSYRVRRQQLWTRSDNENSAEMKLKLLIIISSLLWTGLCQDCSDLYQDNIYCQDVHSNAKYSPAPLP